MTTYRTVTKYRERDERADSLMRLVTTYLIVSAVFAAAVIVITIVW